MSVPEVKEYLFIDKDETLGDFYKRENPFNPGSLEFLKLQQRLNRRVVIASLASTHACTEHLEGAKDFITDYFGADLINSAKYAFHINEDNSIVSLRRFSFTETDNQAKFLPIKPGNVAPYFPIMHAPKDLSVARRRLDPIEHKTLRCVMVGDIGDNTFLFQTN